MYILKTLVIAIMYFMIACSFGAQLKAQPTAIAVMEARVNIVSGVGISAINSKKIQVPVTMTDLVDLGVFVVTTLPGMDISAHIKNTFPEDAQESMFSRLSSQDNLTEMGVWEISLTGLLSNEVVIQPNEENISVVVDYL